jgi:hypothetical protein
MAEVLSRNTEDRSLRSAESVAYHRPSSLKRSRSFKYYIHDSVPTLRFQLIGDLRVAQIAELNGSWETARTTLSLRRFVLDVSHLYSADEAGRAWLRKMKEAGAQFLPQNYMMDSPAVSQDPPPRPEQTQTVCLSLLGRVLGKLRGGR